MRPGETARRATVEDDSGPDYRMLVPAAVAWPAATVAVERAN